MQKQIMEWNTVKKIWMLSQGSNLFEQWELFSETWPTSGTMRDGVVYELPMQAHPITDSESSLLPTLKARDSQPEGYEAGFRRSQPQLGTIVCAVVKGDERLGLLPTPTVGHVRNHDEPVEDYLQRRQDFVDGKTKGMPGASLGVAVRMEITNDDVVADSDQKGL